MARDASSTSNDLTTAMLLAAVGGLVDAVVFLDHHHVFATTMTGNLILLATTLLSDAPRQSVRFLLPMCAYLVGIYCAWGLRDPEKPQRVPMGLVFQAAVLGVVAYLTGRLPDLAVTTVLAFATAAQVANYREVDGFPYNSMFMTGNLRSMMEGLYDGFSRRSDATDDTRTKARRKAWDMAMVAAAFVAAVVAGAALSARYQDRALWAGVPVLLLVAGFRLVQDR